MNAETLQERLTKLAYAMTDNFCYGCYLVVPSDRCPRCYSDDFMRHLSGVGVEYGTEWVVEHLIHESCQPVAAEELFEELLDDCYDEIKLCNLYYLPSKVFKEVDPIAFRVGVSDMLADSDQFYECGEHHYLIEDIENMVTELEDQDDDTDGSHESPAKPNVPTLPKKTTPIDVIKQGITHAKTITSPILSRWKRAIRNRIEKTCII